MANWYNPRRMTDGGSNTYKPTAPRYRAPVRQPVRQAPTNNNRPWWINPDDEEAQGRPTTTIANNDPRMLEAKRKNAESRSLEQYNDFIQKTRAARQEAEKQAEREAYYQPNVWNPIAGPVKSLEMQERERLSALRGMNDDMLNDWITRQPNPKKASQEAFQEFLNLFQEDYPNYSAYMSSGSNKIDDAALTTGYGYNLGPSHTPQPFRFGNWRGENYIKRERNLVADSTFGSGVAGIYSALENTTDDNRNWFTEGLSSLSGDPLDFFQEARKRGIKIPKTFHEQFIESQPTQEQIKADQEADSIQQTYRRAAELFIPAPKGHDPKNPPINSLEWYMKGVREGWIYDPEVPKSLKGGDYTSNYYTTDPNSGNDIRYFYGADPFTGEVGIHPYSRLERRQDRLMGGNWLLPTLSDTRNHEWYSPMSGLPFSSGGTQNYLQNVYRSLIEFKNRNKMGMDNLGNIGEPWQGMKNTSLGIDFQYLPGLSLLEDDPNTQDENQPAPGPGGGGGGSGYSYTGSANPFYYSTPPGGSGGGYGGYGSRGYGYTGQYSNPANYYNNQFQSRKGEHFSELARWVI